MSNLTDYIPHGAIAALIGVVTYVFKDHAKRDDTRFSATFEALKSMSAKLDTATAKQADNHAEILKILLDKKV